MQFKDVIGQEKVKSNLIQMIQDNRLSHALLFLGHEGNGALPLALAFAQYIVCQNAGSFVDLPAEASLFGEAMPPRETPQDSCGVCHACVTSQAFVHPDIHFSFPVISKSGGTKDDGGKKSGSKPISDDFIAEWRTFLQTNPYGNIYDWLQSIHAENKQGNISAEECNSIIRTLNLKSFESGYKILIMWMPEYLTKEGNKLLKLIEEPPANTIFLFVAEDTEKNLPTILSRCQLVQVGRLDKTDVEKSLVEQLKIPAQEAASVALLSQGNYREALQQVHQHKGMNWEQMLRDWLNVIYQSNTIRQAKWVDEIGSLGREDLKQFFKYFNHMLEICIRLRTLGNEILQLPNVELDFATKINKLATLEQQQEIILLLDNAAYYVERNAHSKMLFHALTIQLSHIIKENAVLLTY